MKKQKILIPYKKSVRKTNVQLRLLKKLETEFKKNKKK